jgi:hypothetical protein
MKSEVDTILPRLSKHYEDSVRSCLSVEFSYGNVHPHFEYNAGRSSIFRSATLGVRKIIKIQSERDHHQDGPPSFS